MCGISGILHLNQEQACDRQLLERMNACIYHRGPDSDGFYVNGPVGLAMRRLAIIDLNTGDQPIPNEDQTIWIVFNGEIFNFPDLRAKLEEKGHQFRTNTDTEAIVHLYEEYGPDCVSHLRGQFAFAIWDLNKKRLFLARDRLGQKPLYYALHNNTLYFGSELKTILQVPGLPREVNLASLHHYLTLMYVPDPDTAFEGVHKLPPAHRMVMDLSGGMPQIDRYWDLDYEPKWNESEEALRARLREKIEEAVRIRLVSDVPLGAHLSGGIDSTIIVGLMAGMMNQPVKTFSIGFSEARYSETVYARQIADLFGTDHHEFVMEPDALSLISDMMGHFDEPFADPAALPTWYLSEMTRKHVTVALNGDGGDEAFAGYARYYGDVYVDMYRMVPGFIRHGIMDPIIARLPIQAERPMEQSYTAALRGLARGADVPHSASKARWSTFFQEKEKWALYNDEMRAAINRKLVSADLYTETFRQAKARHRVDKTLYTDIHHYLPGALLPKVDRMTMAHSLEARSPFLDHEVMELAARLPVNWKIKRRVTKWILRDLFKDLMPPNIEKRPKSGFSVPLGPWLKRELYEPARELLLSSDSRVQAYLRADEMGRLLEENKAGRDNHGKRLWSLLNLEVWLRKYC
jgi:asparagine synthase (glutamine-hydrolysing)